MTDRDLRTDSAPADDAEVDSTCAGSPPTRLLVRDVFTMAADKWSMPVISALSGPPVRFTQLMADVEGVSHRMLTRTLRALERDGLVSRTSYPESPPRVEYALTPLGCTLTEPVRAMVRWTHDHQDEIRASRERFAR